MAKKLLLVAAIALGVLVVAIAVAFLVDFDSPELGEAVVAKANEATGARFTVGRYRLNLIRGLELEDVGVRTTLPGAELAAQLDGLVLKHRLLPLLFGKVAVEQIVLLRPQVELIEGVEAKRDVPRRRAGEAGEPHSETRSEGEEGEEVLPEEAPGEVGGLELEIAEIRIEDAAIRVRRGDAEEAATTVDGLNVLLQDLSYRPGALSVIHALSASGSLDIDALSLDSTEVREVSGGLRLDNGSFEGRDLAFHTEEGQFRAQLAVDFNQIPFGYTLSLQGDPLDVNAIAGATDGGFGPGLLTFDAEGYGADSGGLKGKGVLHLAAGTLPSTPALVGIEKAIGRGTSLVGAPYEATEAPFSIGNNRLTLDGFQLETPQAALDLKGTADLDGPLALNLVLRTPREGLVINEVPNEVLDALADDEGWVSVPLRVTGTREEPRVRPDAQALLAQAKKSTGKVIKEGVKSFLERAFN